MGENTTATHYCVAAENIPYPPPPRIVFWFEPPTPPEIPI